MIEATISRGFGRAKAFSVQAELLQPADLEVFDDDVALPGEFADERRAFRLGEVDRRGLLAAVGAEEIGGDAILTFAMPGRTPMTRIVANARPLDLDHLRAEVREKLRAPGSRENARQRSRTRIPASGGVTACACSRACGRQAPPARHYGPGAPVTPPPGMCTRAAQIEARQRHAIIGRADHRPSAEQLVEAHLAVEDVAADQTEAALEIRAANGSAAQ